MWFVHLCNAAQETVLMMFSFLLLRNKKYVNGMGGVGIVVSELILSICCWCAVFISWRNWLICSWVFGKMLFVLSVFIHLKLKKKDFLCSLMQKETRSLILEKASK